jgi:hypothetical protein
VIGCAFSGNQHGKVDALQDKRGGELLIAITSDNKHTVHIWRWMIASETVSSPDDKVARAFFKALIIPSWHYGPEKKLPALKREHKFYCTRPDDPDGPKAHIPGAQYILPCGWIDLPSSQRCTESFDPQHIAAASSASAVATSTLPHCFLEGNLLLAVCALCAQGGRSSTTFMRHSCSV